jgi:nucleoside-diphosphate-sugar epimerase
VSKVLVIGGAGYVGGYLTDLAIEQGHDVRVYDKLLYEDAYLKNVDFAFGDILDRKAMKPHLDWADTIILLAGFVGDPACALNPELTMNTNLPFDLFGVRRARRPADRGEPVCASFSLR